MALSDSGPIAPASSDIFTRRSGSETAGLRTLPRLERHLHEAKRLEHGGVSPLPPRRFRAGRCCHVLQQASVRFWIGIFESPVLEQTANLLTQLRLGSRSSKLGSTISILSPL